MSKFKLSLVVLGLATAIYFPVIALAEDTTSSTDTTSTDTTTTDTTDSTSTDSTSTDTTSTDTTDSTSTDTTSTDTTDSTSTDTTDSTNADSSTTDSTSTDSTDTDSTSIDEPSGTTTDTTTTEDTATTRYSRYYEDPDRDGHGTTGKYLVLKHRTTNPPGYILWPTGKITDNCPLKYNPDQKDSDGDGKGDACEVTSTRVLTPRPTATPISGVTTPTPRVDRSAADYTLPAGVRIVKSPIHASVYWVENGVRHAFANRAVYASWFPDFRYLENLSPTEVESFTLGNPKGVQPGTLLLKFPYNPKVYQVLTDGSLQHIPNEATAKSRYGNAWTGKIIVLPEIYSLFYTFN